MGIIEKLVKSSNRKYTEGKDCISKRNIKRYYKIKVETSNQQNLYYEKNRDKILQKQNERYINFKEVLRNYVLLQNRMKTLEENFLMKDSENKTDDYYIDGF